MIIGSKYYEMIENLTNKKEYPYIPRFEVLRLYVLTFKKIKAI